MKSGARKNIFGGKIRWLPLFLFIMGLGPQIAGSWLPTRVICYKANEKPKIEFSTNGCECSHTSSDITLRGLHEDSASLHSGCLDVPLTMDPAYGSPLRPAVVNSGLGIETRSSGVTPLPHFPLYWEMGVEYLPPRMEGSGVFSALVQFQGGSASRLCRFRC